MFGERSIGFFAAVLVLFSAGAAFGLTCDQCREIEKKKSETQVELARKEKDIEAAFKRKDYRKVSEIREVLNQLRGQLLSYRQKDEVCRYACKPDIVKEAECQRLMEEIVRLEGNGAPNGPTPAPDADSASKKPESTEPAAAAAGNTSGAAAAAGETGKEASSENAKPLTREEKIDALYRDLSRCNRDYKKMKQLAK